MCECRDMSMDMRTPRNVYLSAFYKRSFAYHTVKNRMPVILTQIIDNLLRSKEDIVKEFGEGAAEDVKKVISELSKYKYEVQTNKPLTKLTTNDPDIKIYNDYIDKQATEEGETTHFNTIWLLTECYMYRRIKEMFVLTNTLKNFDYFQTSKMEQYEKANDLMKYLSKYVVETSAESSTCDHKKELIKMLKVNLWGNKCDLSISLGKVDGPGKLHNVEKLEEYILADDSEKIYHTLTTPTMENDETIDIVLDNSGYELFTDLCLMDFVHTFSLAKKVRFHVKAIPWFISDVTENDFHWTIKQLCEHEDPFMKTLGLRWKEFLSSEEWTVVVDPFWTLPYEFKYMQDLAPELYKTLTTSKLIIFKGDLNYRYNWTITISVVQRKELPLPLQQDEMLACKIFETITQLVTCCCGKRKLFGEINWDPTTPVEEALQGFLPSKLCILRTIKADIVAGLKPGIAEKCEALDPKWMENGDYGLIQSAIKLSKTW